MQGQGRRFFPPLAGWLLFLTKFMNMNKQSWGRGEGVGKEIFFVRSGRRQYTFLNKDCFGFISHSIFEVYFISATAGRKISIYFSFFALSRWFDYCLMQSHSIKPAKAR